MSSFRSVDGPFIGGWGCGHDSIAQRANQQEVQGREGVLPEVFVGDQHIFLSRVCAPTLTDKPRGAGDFEPYSSSGMYVRRSMRARQRNIWNISQRANFDVQGKMWWIFFSYTFIGETPWLGHCRNMLLETNNCCKVFGNVVFENVDLLIGEILRSKFMMKCRVFENVELLIIEICCRKLITIVEFSKM